MSNEMKDWIKDNNYELCQKYPFLIPRDRFSGKIAENYDYSWTELDAMPDGWRFAFGEQMCKEIEEALGNAVDVYRIAQIKEKFGELRWYDFGAPDEVWEILEKYRKLSQTICVKCGDPATKISIGWINPYCDNCIGDKPCMDIEKWFKEDEV